MSKFKWYANRLSMMSAFEVLHRSRIAILNSWYYHSAKQFKVPPPKKCETNWLWEFLDDYSFDDFSCEQVLNAADLILLRKNIDKQSESAEFYHVCESNRHVYLVTLARAYFLSGDAKYKKEIAEQLSEWIANNPYYSGLHWKDALSMGVRLKAWAIIKGLCGAFEPDLEKVWHECIYKHCHVISRNFAAHSSANNHLIGEAAGLFIASTIWPYWKQSAKWQKKSFAVLLSEMENQTFSDGVNKEQAMAYQRTTLDLFLFPALVGAVNDHPFPKSYWDGIEKMLNYIGSVMDKSGHVPDYGDGGYSDQLVILSNETNFNSFRTLLATGAVLFERGDFKTKAEYFDEKSFWLLGPKGSKKFTDLPSKPFKSRTKFEAAGYYILCKDEGSENEVKCFFDCGPLGFLSIAAHGHADALSFTLSAYGREFIIDPGTFTYHKSERAWRDYFRGTGAHNTIRIDGQNQSVSGGDFMWLKKANARVLHFEDNDDYCKVIGVHDGYLRLPDPVSHEREIVLDKSEGVLKIYDRLSAKGTHKLEQFFHLSSACDVVLNNGVYQIRNNGKAIDLNIDPILRGQIIKGANDPICGWQSPAFNVLNESFTIVCEAVFDGSITIKTELSL